MKLHTASFKSKYNFEMPLPEQIRKLPNTDILNRVGISTLLIEDNSGLTKEYVKYLISYRRYLLDVYKWRLSEPLFNY